MFNFSRKDLEVSSSIKTHFAFLHGSFQKRFLSIALKMIHISSLRYKHSLTNLHFASVCRGFRTAGTLHVFWSFTLSFGSFPFQSPFLLTSW
jgi:hypothetical protein